MKPWFKACWQGARFCCGCVLTCCLWTFWLALGLLALAQVHVGIKRELPVPGIVLRAFEERLASSGMTPHFGRTSFDPSGRLVIEDLRLHFPGFAEPAITCRTLLVRLDPWALLAGYFAATEVQLSDAELLIPAMLSRSGRHEPLLRNVELAVRPGEKKLVLDRFTARLATIEVTAHGEFWLPPMREKPPSAQSIVEELVARYPQLCREYAAIDPWLAGLEQGRLRLELTPSETHSAMVAGEFTVRRWILPAPAGLTATGLMVQATLPVFGDAAMAAKIEIEAEDVADNRGAVHGARVVLRGVFRPSQLHFGPREAEFGAAAMAAAGFIVRDVSARVTATPWPALKADVLLRAGTEPLAATVSIQTDRKSATAHLEGRLDPALLQPVGRLLRHDLENYVGFGSPIAIAGQLDVAPGWQFGRFAGRIAADGVIAYHVPLGTVGGRVSYDGHVFRATDAFARRGDNIAHGSFEQDFRTLDYRFLLHGRLRPEDIGGWFGPWWPDFWENFEFTADPPSADVDVRGRWKNPAGTTVFVFAEAPSPVIRKAAFDHVRTLLFIRPYFFDGLELFATRGAGAGRGAFTLTNDPHAHDLREMIFAGESSLGFDTLAPLLAPISGGIVEAVTFENPPVLSAEGRIEGATATGGAGHSLDLRLQSTGKVTFHHLPLSNLSLSAALRGDEVRVESIRTGFADGTVSGKLLLSGTGERRRLGFDLAMREARLADAVAAWEEYQAHRDPPAKDTPSALVAKSADVRLNITVSAEGLLADALSFHGGGNAEVTGRELGEIRLLGLLSELLNFTSLRFNTARANFQLAGPKLTFPLIKLTGANTAVEAQGEYALAPRSLDFKARVFPFGESTFLLKNVVDTLLKPFSNILVVRLTGTLDKPAWALVMGPANFLRARSQPSPLAEPLPAPEKRPGTTPPPYLQRDDGRGFAP